MAPKKTDNEGEMTFLEHLEEMRGVILKSLLVFVVALIVVGCGFSYFNTVMLYPLNAAKKIIASTEFLSIGGEKRDAPEKIGPVYLVDETPTSASANAESGRAKRSGPYYIVAKDEKTVLLGDGKDNWYDSIKLRSMTFATPIIVWFYVSFLGALGISFPVMLYFVVQFVAPGLTREEKKLLRPGIIAAIILFCVGVAFAFGFMLPMGIAFMSYMSESMQMEMFPDAQSYYSMVLFLTLAVGVVFEAPLLQVILIYLGVLNVEWLKKNRRIVFLIILIFATVITPPDFITQVSLTIPLYLMYEIALRLGAKMRKNKLCREAERERKEEIEDEKERQEYIRAMARERIAEAEAEKAEEAAEFEIDKSRYGQESIPDDYDPNKIDDDMESYGYEFDDENYPLDPYMDYDTPQHPVPDFAPDWNLNRVDTSFMSPDWSLNETPAKPETGGESRAGDDKTA